MDAAFAPEGYVHLTPQNSMVLIGHRADVLEVLRSQALTVECTLFMEAQREQSKSRCLTPMKSMPPLHGHR
jgi:hypothetical protein